MCAVTWEWEQMKKYVGNTGENIVAESQKMTSMNKRFIICFLFCVVMCECVLLLCFIARFHG